MFEMFRGRSGRDEESIVAAEDVQAVAARAPGLVNAAAEGSWYTEPGNDVDAAVVALCLLRRAASGDRARTEAGDEAVRTALHEAEPDAVVWLASRLVSYMDEHGFPEDVEPWLARER